MSVSASRIRVKLGALLGRGTAFSPVVGSPFGEDALIAQLAADSNAKRVCVDIGAHDGITMSNSFKLFRSGWTGLAIELDEQRFGELKKLHRGRDINVKQAKVTPANINVMLRVSGIPSDFGVLSLDIDGYDFYVLEAILAEFRPAVICTEINERIPPPLRFALKYSDNYECDGGACYGQSISKVEQLCEQCNYSIVRLICNNVILMPSEIAPASLSAKAAYVEGFAEMPDRKERFPNDGWEPVASMGTPAARDFIEQEFAYRAGKYILED